MAEIERGYRLSHAQDCREMNVCKSIDARYGRPSGNNNDPQYRDEQIGGAAGLIRGYDQHFVVLNELIVGH